MCKLVLSIVERIFGITLGKHSLFINRHKMSKRKQKETKQFKKRQFDTKQKIVANKEGTLRLGYSLENFFGENLLSPFHLILPFHFSFMFFCIGKLWMRVFKQHNCTDVAIENCTLRLFLQQCPAKKSSTVHAKAHDSERCSLWKRAALSECPMYIFTLNTGSPIRTILINLIANEISVN